MSSECIIEDTGHNKSHSLPAFSSARVVGFLFATFIITSCLSASAAFGQQAPPDVAASNVAALRPSGEDTRYRIGPGDVLTVAVRKAPELSGPVRVDQRGMIRLPMIEGEITAACRTEGELATEIATLYLKYKNNPTVEVFVAEFQSRPVSVIGAVNAPGQFRLQRQVRLLELLSFAGGPSASAGRVINVIHTGAPDICARRSAATTAAAPGLTVFELNDTLKGKEEANPFVQPGDMVSLPEADQVFVVGHVMQPRAISLKDKQITVSRAIAMAGGAARDGKTSKIKVLREVAGGEKQELIVDLKAIQKRRAVDLVLMPNDVVEVGASVSKTILQMLTGTASSAISSGVVRAIP